MTTIKVKGYDVHPTLIRDTFDRRAQQLKNKIIAVFGKIGLTEDDIDLVLAPSAVKSIPAEVSWYLEGHHLHFSFASNRKYVENLAIIHKVLELEANALLLGAKTLDDFIRDFSEDKDIKKQRLEARELLGIGPHVIDLEQINANYKEMAKKFHPDMPEGDPEKFKEINRAHKILRRELQ